MSKTVKDEDAVKREHLSRTPVMDRVFIQSMLNQQATGLTGLSHLKLMLIW